MSRGERGYQPMTTMLGIQQDREGVAEAYEAARVVQDHKFVVAPATRFHNRQAEAKFAALVGGSADPIKFSAERFDSLRERLQIAQKRDKDAQMQCIAAMYSEHLSRAFVNQRGLDLAEFERIFYPSYLPTYDAAMKAVGLKRPFYWKRRLFADLENISRLPLEKCNRDKEAVLSFQEFYGLMWNYYSPFNANAYLNTILAQNYIVNKELVDGVADHLAWRLSTLDPSARKNPILFIGAKTGRFGHFLNETKKLPVPVVHVHENPNTNPYLLLIPRDKQSEFKPHPVIKMKNQPAIEKYQPSIVLCSDFTAHTDETALIRAQGCVREYLYFGISDSYAEGSAWDTWGNFRYRKRDDTSLPTYVQDNWLKMSMSHLSRWMIHKNDSELLQGIGTVTSFVRRPLRPPYSKLLEWRMARLKPFF